MYRADESNADSVREDAVDQVFRNECVDGLFFVAEIHSDNDELQQFSSDGQVSSFAHGVEHDAAIASIYEDPAPAIVESASSLNFANDAASESQTLANTSISVAGNWRRQHALV